MKKIILVGLCGACAITLLVAATGPILQGVRVLRETNGEATALLVRGGLRLLNATGGRATLYDPNGVLTNGPVTSAELLFLSGVSSAIQGQLDSKPSNATLVGSTNDLSNALIVRMDAATNALAGVFETRVVLATNTTFSYVRSYANSATQALDATLRAVIVAATNNASSTSYTDAATNVTAGYVRSYANSTTQALAAVVAQNLSSTSNNLYGQIATGAATVPQLNAASNAIISFVTPSFTNIPGSVIDWFNPGHYKIISGNTQFSFINTNESPIGIEVVIGAAGGLYGVTFNFNNTGITWVNGSPPTNIVNGIRHYHFWQITNVVHGEWVPYTTNGNPMLPISYVVASTNVVVDFNYPAQTLTASSSINFIHSTNKLHQVRLKTEFKILPYVSDRLMFFHNNWAPTFSITNAQITALHSTNGIRLASNMLYYASFVSDAIAEDAVGFFDFRGGPFTALPPQLLVDLVPANIYGAWSIARKLKYSYAGSAIRIRASADDAETDIGFDGNYNLDTNAIVAFAAAHASSTACFVVRVYDQDGTGNNDLSQPNPAAQPWIYSNSVVRVASNGRPAVYSDGGKLLTNMSASVSHPLTVYAVMQRVRFNANKVLLGGGVGANVTVEQTGDSDQIRLYSGIYLTPVTGVTTNLVSLIFAKYNVPNSAMRFNNGSYSTGDSGSFDPDGLSFMDQSNGLQGSESMFIEAVAYNEAHVNGGQPSITISDNVNGYNIIW